MRSWLVFSYREEAVANKNAGEPRFRGVAFVASHKALPTRFGVKKNMPRNSLILKQVGRVRLDSLQSRIPAHQKYTGRESECGDTARVQKPTPRCVVPCGWSTTASGADVKLPRAASRSAAINRPSACGSPRMRLQTLRRSTAPFSGTSGRLIESESYILPIRNKIKTINSTNPMPPLGP